MDSKVGIHRLEDICLHVQVSAGPLFEHVCPPKLTAFDVVQQFQIALVLNLRAQSAYASLKPY